MAKQKNANGNGSISFEKAKNSFRAAVTDPQGKRIVKRFKTKPEAEEWLTLIRSEIFRDVYVPPSDITLGEWIVEYLATYKKGVVRPKTLNTYLQSAKLVEPINFIKIQDLTALSVQKYYSTMLAKYSYSTKIRVHKLLKAVMTKAHQLDMISKNIMIAVEPPKAEKKEIVVFTQEELQKILKTIKGSEYYSGYYTFFLTAITTGARIGELLGLQKSDVHKGYITITKTIVDINGKPVESLPKTEAGRRKITISAELERLLRKQIAEVGKKVIVYSPYLFHTENGTPYSPRNMQRTWAKILKLAGIPHKNFHTIRHTHATQLLGLNVPILEVAKRLGHSKTSHTLNLYGHAIPDYDTTIPQKFEDFLSL